MELIQAIEFNFDIVVAAAEFVDFAVKKY